MKSFLVKGQRFFIANESDDFTLQNIKIDGGVVLYPHDLTQPPVNLTEEISGKQKRIKSLCDLSKNLNATLLAGVELSLKSVLRLSAIVTHNGELKDIVDSCTALPPYARAGSIKIFKTENLKMAVTVGGDAKYRAILGKIKNKCDIVINLDPDYSLEGEYILRELSDEFNLPILYCCKNKFFFNQPLLN